MRSRYLFPYRSRYLGIFLILLHIPVTVAWRHSNSGQAFHGLATDTMDSMLFTKNLFFFITSSVLVLLGLFLIAFSKEKIEDEQIFQLRLDSLRWAIYCNYLILILSIVFTNGIDFIDMLRLNLWVPLVFFIIRFRWVLFRLNRSLN